MYRSILVPLDGSAFGEQALSMALSIARPAGARLHLAHVHVAQRSAAAHAGPAVDRPLPAPAPAPEHTYLDGVIQRLAALWDGPITPTVLDGPVAAALQDHAEAIGADLIVMTTHGRGPLSRLWLGSVADTLIRRVATPILLVRPHEAVVDVTHAPVCKHILILLDGSRLAEQILAPAVALGRLMQAEYTLLQAIEPVVIEGIGREEQGPQQLEARAWSYLDRIAGQLRAEDLCVRTDVIVAEHPASGILDYARSQPVDLIALATHGRGGMTRMLLGSVTDKVVRAGATPVLLQHPRSDEVVDG